MNEIIEYNVWRENFLHSFRQITTDEEFRKLSLCYPDNKSDKDKCKQRKNNLLRKGNRNIYLDDLYAVSCYSDKTPNSLLLGENNIASFWSGLAGENLFERATISKIQDALKSDKNYRNIFIPTEIDDFLYYAKATIFNINKKKIGNSIFNVTDNSLDFVTTGNAEYSYNLNLFNGSFVYDVFCDYVLDLEIEDFPECENEDFEMFKSTVDIYLDCGECVVGNTDKDVNKRIKNWVCNCTMWLVLSYIGDTCQRLSIDIENYLKDHKDVIKFMLTLFVFGTKTTLQKRITDEATNEKKRIRYSAFLDCTNEKLVAERADLDYYEDTISFKTASFSDMQKSSLSDILNFDLR